MEYYLKYKQNHLKILLDWVKSYLLLYYYVTIPFKFETSTKFNENQIIKNIKNENLPNTIVCNN